MRASNQKGVIREIKKKQMKQNNRKWEKFY